LQNFEKFENLFRSDGDLYLKLYTDDSTRKKLKFLETRKIQLEKNE